MAIPQLLQQSGKFANIAANNQVFMGSTLIAGVALPVMAATLASKFTLWNPPASGKFVELVEFAMGVDSATTVVNGVGYSLQFGVSTYAGGLPSAPTIAAGANTTTGGLSTTGKVSSFAQLYSALTLTNVAISNMGPVMMIIGGFTATTDTGFAPPPYRFDGTVYMPPDTLVTFVTSVAPATAAPCSLTWIEW